MEFPLYISIQNNCISNRLLLLFIPRKYQPDYVFLKYVPLHRVHLFTFFQVRQICCSMNATYCPHKFIFLPSLADIPDPAVGH